MSKLLIRWLAGREEVHVAQTREEREALYALRYEVYGLEKGWAFGGVDHARKRVFDESDEHPSSRHLYAGSMPGSEIKGTLRCRIFEPGQAPESFAGPFGLAKIPGVERYRIGELGRFAIRKEHRGGVVMPALVRGVAEKFVGEEGVDLLFCECRPHMVKHYRKMGFRPYDTPNIETSEGLSVPLVLVPSDDAHMRKFAPLFAADTRAAVRQAGRPPVDLRAMASIWANERLRMLDESREVFAELERSAVRMEGISQNFPLSRTIIEEGARAGFLLDVDAGENLMREGRGEREAFLVLEGRVEVLVAGSSLRSLGPGELLGEMSWFLEGGRRTATVRAQSRCRVLVVDRKFVDELALRDPHAALDVYRAIGKSMAQRLDSLSQALAERDARLAVLTGAADSKSG